MDSTGAVELATNSMCAEQQTPMYQSAREASVSDLVGIECRKSGGSIMVEQDLLPVGETSGYSLNSLRPSNSLDFPLLDSQNFESSAFQDSGEAPDSVKEADGKPTTPSGDASKINMSQVASSAGTTTSATPFLTPSVARRASYQGTYKDHVPVPRTTSAPLDSALPDEQSNKSENTLLEIKVEDTLSLECNVFPAEGYWGDNDQPHPGSLSPTSHPEPRIGGREGLKEFQLSLCGHLLQRDMTPVEAQAVFEEYLIGKVMFVQSEVKLFFAQQFSFFQPTESHSLCCRIIFSSVG